MENIIMELIAIIFCIYAWKGIIKFIQKYKHKIKEYINNTPYSASYSINTNGYNVKKNPMTYTEKTFLQLLKEICDNYNLIVIPQVNLQNIFYTTSNANFNKIRAKSVDFAIVDTNYNYKGFIELDDYTHQRADRIQRDIFVNSLFSANNLKLYRIKVKKEYDKEELNRIIKEVA